MIDGLDPQPAAVERGPRLLLTVEEAAECLGVGRTLLYQQLRRGRLRSVRVGRCRRIAPADLRDFVDSLRGGPGGGRSSDKSENDLSPS